MSKVLVVVGHPDLSQSKANRALVDAVRELAHVTVHDLSPPTLTSSVVLYQNTGCWLYQNTGCWKTITSWSASSACSASTSNAATSCSGGDAPPLGLKERDPQRSWNFRARPPRPRGPALRPSRRRGLPHRDAGPTCRTGSRRSPRGRGPSRPAGRARGPRCPSVGVQGRGLEGGDDAQPHLLAGQHTPVTAGIRRGSTTRFSPPRPRPRMVFTAPTGRPFGEGVKSAA